MNEHEGATLQNVLSVSTAANNRYLLHFNSLNALTQWTAGIRLAMYEHATLQEAYTGSLIAGKGKQLNNIRQVMERSRFKYEDWARVRFGAGTPWRRCWFVITPPDEKEYQKMQKKSAKKNLYEKAPVLKGDLKFYETSKVTKKTMPIATISNAYSAYAIYPQSKPLIDQSTLVKVEGKITIHSKQESVTDGLVFVMPETHPAVSGFEMLLRFLFPVWDTFALYGRPNRLIADVLDQRGLMFAMPKDRRYGYLEILDVAGLIHEEGSSRWGEREWRKNMKELTSKRMLAIAEGGVETLGHRKSASRTSLPARSNTLRFDDGPSGRSTPQGYSSPRRTETAPGELALHHRRSASEAHSFPDKFVRDTPSALSQRSQAYGNETPPPRPPPHGQLSGDNVRGTTFDSSSEHSTEGPSPDGQVPPELKAMSARSPPPGPVGAPPTFAHAPSQKPRTRPNQAQELRRGQSELDPATLSQMAEATQGRSAQTGAVQGLSRAMDQHAGPPVNGYHGGHDNGYRSNDQYQQGAQLNPKSRDQSRGHTPLATIPASPFIEQVSPILDKAGSQLPYQQQFPQIAQTPAIGIAMSTHEGQIGSGVPPSEPRRRSSQDKPELERSGSSFSMHRKPVGDPAHTEQQQGSPPRLRKDMPSNQPWPNAQPSSYSQQQQGPPQGYNGYPQQGYSPQQRQQRGPMYPGSDPRRDQSPYRQPGHPPQHQLPPNAGQQGQMSMRGGPPPQQWPNAQPNPYEQPPMQQQGPPQQQRSKGQGQQWI
jgi:CCR4-NOT transcriptional complex subunit CAF120